MNRRLLALLCPAPLILGWIQADPPALGAPMPTGVRADGKQLLADVQAFVEATGPRPVGSKAAAWATEWVEAELSKAGLRFRREHGTVGEAQRFWADLGLPKLHATLRKETPVRNVVVRFPQTVVDRARLGGHILVMAHTDSVPGSPGAEDDASGVAVALDLCRFLRSHPPRRPVTVAFTDGEEAGLLGASILAGRMTPQERDALSLAFAIEMCGWGDTPYLHWFRAAHVSRFEQPAPPDEILALMFASSKSARAPLAQADPLIGWLYPALRNLIAIPNDADHRPFGLLGRPAMMMTTSSLSGIYPEYHSPRDTIDKLTAETLAHSATGVRAAIYSLGHAPQLGRADAAAGYPIFGRVIPPLHLHLALGACALALLLTGSLIGRIGAIPFLAIALPAPPSLVAVALGVPAAFCGLWASSMNGRFLQMLFAAGGLAPTILSVGTILFALDQFGSDTLVELPPTETVLISAAVLSSFVLGWRRRTDGKQTANPSQVAAPQGRA